jgi:Cysteine rich repeat
MKKLLVILISGIAVTGSGLAMAQDTILDHVIEACKDDLQKYCSQVTPGEGRILYCVAAHEDKLSGQCDYAMYQAASLLEQLSVAIAYVANSCSAEIETLCSNVEAGEGRIVACLDDNESQLGDACKKAISDTVGE